LLLGARKLAEGSVEMIAQLLALLTAFIGHELTVRFLREAWPKVNFKDSKSNSGGEK
jgi:hypothetical protein